MGGWVGGREIESSMYWVGGWVGGRLTQHTHAYIHLFMGGGGGGGDRLTHTSGLYISNPPTHPPTSLYPMTHSQDGPPRRSMEALPFESDFQGTVFLHPPTHPSTHPMHTAASFFSIFSHNPPTHSPTQVCPTYPPLLAVPASISDAFLATAASCRSKQVGGWVGG